ncbi:Transcriptional adapter 1 [Branchiostoma belcheri]|nr:Transcriptional adapter 1 [Branchiostoma belcheri]
MREDVPTEDNYTLPPDSSEVIAISCTATSVSAKNPTVLSCDYCQLVQLPTIDDENITKLSLNWNNITDILNLPYLPKVKTINMNHNLITALRWPWLTNAPCLEHLDLSYNRIVHVSGRDVLIESCNSTEDTASVRNRGQVIEPRVNMTADITVRLTPSNTSRVAPNAFSPLSVSTTQMTPVYQRTFSTVSMSNALEEEQDITIPMTASVSGTMFMIAVLALSLWERRRRLQRQRAKALQQLLQASHSLLHNQMYGMDSNQQRLDNRAAVPSQAGCAEIQPYAEVPLSKIEDSTSQDCDTNHIYTYIKDDVHSARQLVEANQRGDEEGRYETIPNELGCTGVEPYAEIPLSNIAVEPVMAEVECHARDEGKDTNIETSSLQPSVSDSRLVIEEIETSQTPGLLDISHGGCQMETVPKATHVSVAAFTDDEMTDVAEDDDSAVQSTSNETVYRNEADSQESTSSDVALLSEKDRRDRKNTVNETVYRNATDSQESTSREAVLLSGQTRQDRKNTLNEIVYRNAADSQESTSREAVLLSGQNHQDSKNTENGAYCAT